MSEHGCMAAWRGVTTYWQPKSETVMHGLQVGAPAEEDLKSWGQHTSTSTVPDSIMRTIGQELPGQVSFVFTCKACPPRPTIIPIQP